MAHVLESFFISTHDDLKPTTSYTVNVSWFNRNPTPGEDMDVHDNSTKVLIAKAGFRNHNLECLLIFRNFT